MREACGWKRAIHTGSGGASRSQTPTDTGSFCPADPGHKGPRRCRFYRWPRTRVDVMGQFTRQSELGRLPETDPDARQEPVPEPVDGAQQDLMAVANDRGHPKIESLPGRTPRDILPGHYHPSLSWRRLSF